MFLEQVKIQLEQKGFQRVQGQTNWYWRAENPVLYLICLLNGEGAWREEQRTFAAFGRRMERKLTDFYCTRLVALSIFVDKEGTELAVDTVESGDISYEDTLLRVFWQVSPKTGVVRAAKGQPTQIIGIEKLLRAAAEGKTPEVILLRDTAEQKKPIATAVIFVICVLLLAVTMLSGRRMEILTSYGLGREGILAEEYYRFLTSIFLHSGLLHLASNSVYLYYFGVRAERLLGTGRFLVLYLFSGFCGGLLSVLLGDGRGISIGASGAIYGLLGAMLLLTKKKGAKYTGMSYSTMLLLAATGVGMGFLESGVDNLGHIGGILGGMAMFSLFLWKKRG